MRPTNGRTCLIVNRVAQYAPAIAVTVVLIGLIGYMIVCTCGIFPTRWKGSALAEQYLAAKESEVRHRTFSRGAALSPDFLFQTST